MAYASSSDLAARFDERTIKDLASDTGAPVTDISTSGRVTAALDDASGRVDSAMLVGGMYSTDQLAALTGNSLAMLKRITCELAMVYLVEARPGRYASDQLEKQKETCEDFLDRLRKGERLFNVQAAIDAGKPTIDGPTTVDYTRLQLIPDRTNNFYPARATRLPTGRGGV